MRPRLEHAQEVMIVTSKDERPLVAEHGWINPDKDAVLRYTWSSDEAPLSLERFAHLYARSGVLPPVPGVPCSPSLGRYGIPNPLDIGEGQLILCFLLQR